MPTDFVALDLKATNEGVELNVNCSSKESAATVLQNIRKFKTISIVSSSGFNEDIVDINGVADMDKDAVDYDPSIEPEYVTTVSFTISCTYNNVIVNEETEEQQGQQEQTEEQ